MSTCKLLGEDWNGLTCLALAYHRMGKSVEANAALNTLLTKYADTAYQIAQVYSQWNDKAKAVEWLQRAFSNHDSGLSFLKTDPLMDPVRSDPRVQEIERELKFPAPE